GFYTGYGVKTLPGIREAVEEELWKEAGEQVSQLAETLRDYNDALQAILAEASSK
ncbi:MAG: transferrin receptor-like dimerization domain-containing protein, partial [Cyclobacteriaceae bacterium]